MVTFAPVVFRHHRRKDGTYPVKIRITFNGVSRYLPTTITAEPGEVTRSLALKPGLKAKLEPTMKKVRDALSQLPPFAVEDHDVGWVVSQVRACMSGGRFRLDFGAFGRDWARKHKRGTTLQAYIRALDALERYKGGPVDVNDITRRDLIDFAAWSDAAPKLQYNRKAGTYAVREGTQKVPGSSARHLAKLAAIFQEAKLRYNDEDAGVLLIPRSPFDGIKRTIPKPTGGQRSVGREVIQRIIDAVPADPAVREALDVFLLSFVTMGANLADLHEAKPLPKGGEWWIYNRMKTRTRRTDRAEIQVRVTPVMRALLSRLQDGPKGWMVPALHRIGALKDTATGKVNGKLHAWQGGEEEPVPAFSFYAARHTWATLARREGVEKATVDEALGHVGDFDLADIYAERSWDLINKANDTVLALFDWSAVTG